MNYFCSLSISCDFSVDFVLFLEYLTTLYQLHCSYTFECDENMITNIEVGQEGPAGGYLAPQANLQPCALPPTHPIYFRKLILCSSSLNKDSAFLISDLVHVTKENNMILNVHCHCSTLHTKYVLKEIHVRI
jgi:hypothetical protein